MEHRIFPCARILVCLGMVAHSMAAYPAHDFRILSYQQACRSASNPVFSLGHNCRVSQLYGCTSQLKEKPLNQSGFFLVLLVPCTELNKTLILYKIISCWNDDSITWISCNTAVKITSFLLKLLLLVTLLSYESQDNKPNAHRWSTTMRLDTKYKGWIRYAVNEKL